MSSPVVTCSFYARVAQVIAVVLFLSSRAHSTSYSVSVSPSTVVIGESVTLSCRITNPTGLNVQWRKNIYWLFIDVEAASTKQGCILNPAYDTSNYRWDICAAPNTSSPRDYNLQIIKAGPSDAGTWDCLDTGAGTPSDRVKVIVQVPPLTPTVTGLDKPVGVGTNHVLACDAHQNGISDPITYTWYKDDIVKTTGSTLPFNPITKADAGTYKCEAKNAVDTKVSRNLDLEVYYQPDAITLSSTKSARPVNQQETFICTTSGGNPPNSILTIYRDKGRTQQLLSGAGPTIQLRDRTMVKDDNNAKFYCESSLSGYPSVLKKSNIITYTVYYPHTVTLSTNSSTTVVAGTTFTLTCNATGGNPENVKQYTWTRNGMTLQSTSRVFYHHDVKYNDGGIYGCTAKNDGGSASDSMNITVNYPPMWNPDLPEILTTRATLNQQAKITLHVIANPAATGATWFRYYGPANFTNLDLDFLPAKVNETTYTLAIKSVKQSYFGQYKVDMTSPTGPSIFFFNLAAAPPITDDKIGVIRRHETITITWPDLGRHYTKIEVEYCVIRGENRGTCATHVVKDISKTQTTITVEEGKEYGYTLRIYDTDDIVFRSAVLGAKGDLPPVAAIAGGTIAAGSVLLIFVIIGVLLIHRKRKEVTINVNRTPAAVTVQDNPVFTGVYDEVTRQGSDEGIYADPVDNREPQDAQPPIYVNIGREPSQSVAPQPLYGNVVTPQPIYVNVAQTHGNPGSYNDQGNEYASLDQCAVNPPDPSPYAELHVGARVVL